MSDAIYIRNYCDGGVIVQLVQMIILEYISREGRQPFHLTFFFLFFLTGLSGLQASREKKGGPTFSSILDISIWTLKHVSLAAL